MQNFKEKVQAIAEQLAEQHAVKYSIPARDWDELPTGLQMVFWRNAEHVYMSQQADKYEEAT